MGCTHDCSTCKSDCNSNKKESFIEKPHEKSSVKKIIGIVSGKGGVGKSSVTGMLSVLAQRNGLKTAILDADITGPSIPKMFNVKEKAVTDGSGIYPQTSKTGLDIMSINLLLENDTDPVVWRGPVISGVVKQFWTDVIWQDEDIMFIDMPPGTGDVPLTVFQSIPIDGIIIVTSPQELVSMIVEKAVKMASLMDIPVLGIVENYSYVKCEDCGKEIKVFGESNIKEIAEKFGIDTISNLPIDPKIASACDKGMIELFENEHLDNMLEKIIKL
ncbi:MAG: Mrp/NBP35 family ATP-binding protein [Ruminococcaceae bacterium]|nr:Mrp/NBP35 family ATP-binding protein [Oscillospiraceae bacterium]